MTRTRAARVFAAGLLLSLAGCAQPGAGGGAGGPAEPEPEVALPADPDAVVLQVSHVGGFVTPETNLTRLPLVTVYADGRVITEGPVIAVYPAPAWPNVQVDTIDRARVEEAVRRALDAGVDETSDLGMPSVTDLPSTRFVVRTATETFVREAYALVDLPPGDPGLTEEQRAARAELRGLLDELTALGGDGTGYPPEAVAVVAQPWWEPADGLEHPELPWPGPPLPGAPVGEGLDLSCLTVTGDQAAAVSAAAQQATVVTPWVTGDGGRWSVAFRPLLPHETGCADLTTS